MNRAVVPLLACLAFVSTGRADESTPLLLQKPAISRSQVAFVYGGDLWLVGREGGEARRLTSGVGLETDPCFSPDGSQIAFTGEYEGNLDVYVIPTAGGLPRRLTYHPGIDACLGWTPDGKSILFRSGRSSYSARFNRLFTIPVDGSFPTELPLPMGEQGSFSPDGTRMAYVPYWNRRSAPNAYIAWKRYRGGMASPIWIANLSDSHIEAIPRRDSNDFNPMWVQDHIYFLSDRNGPVTLFSYDLQSKKVEQLLPNHGLDLRSASAAPDAIVYEQFGSLHLFDLQSHLDRPLEVHIAADLPTVRPHFKKVAKQIQSSNISPTGVRAVFEAHGEILTVPAEKGNIRNLTNSPGVADRYPSWSPDGTSIAFLSDESGEYQLHIVNQRGEGPVKKYRLGKAPSYYYSPLWSPDSKKIAYTDKRLNLWFIDLATGESKLIDTDIYETPFPSFDPAWSPDSRWLAYSKQLKSHLHVIHVYDVKTAHKHQLTDGMSDARYPAFDRDGKHLYLTASTDAGPTTGWLDMTSINRPISSSVYVIVLRKDLPSPLAPESDEETSPEPKPLGLDPQGQSTAAEKAPDVPKKKDKNKAGAKPAEVKVQIDLENIDQRILALPIPPRNYLGLAAGKAGTIFLVEGPHVPRDPSAPPQGQRLTLHKFDLQKRKLEKLIEGITSVDLSHNGEKILYKQGEGWFIASTAAPPKPGEGALKLDPLEVRVDPRAEWKQMYHEVWRIERDFLYDPRAHGLDLHAAEARYRPYLDQLSSRADLNYLFDEMLGELTLGHTYVAGGEGPEITPVPGGLLGADYRIENGRYRIVRIYAGQNWNPQLRSPLTQPGVNVKEGDYLLGVNGKDVRAADNLYRFFEGTADKSVVLRVGPNPDGRGAREVTVVPIVSETQLRNLNWIENNRRLVDRMTNGRIAYIYLPDTGAGGYTNFNRYFFAQVGKDGAIVDERFNGGGSAADYIIDYLRRPLMNYWTTREGEDFTTPVGSIFGPKVMIINQFAGSGGDAMPWYFRHSGIGPLIGKRTWGGLVGIYNYPQLIDGGFVTAPRVAFWNPEGQWEVENHGVDPDIEVDFDPATVRSGHDAQLERAIATVLEALERNPLPHPHRPAFPDYHHGQSPAAAPKDGGPGDRSGH